MIRRLRARNLRSFTDLQSPTFGRVSVILGPNGAGKSSLKDALSLLLSGTCSGYETGIGLATLKTIGSTAKRWQIDAQLEIGGKEEVLSRTDDEGPKSAKQQLVESLTKVSGSKARACLESGELARLDMKARQRLLADLAPRATVTLPPAIKKAVYDLLGEDHAEVEVSAIQRLYKAAYEARTEAARDVKARGELDAPAVPEGLDGIEDLDGELHEVKVQLIALRSERDVALGKAAPKVTDTRPYQMAVEKTNRELERVQQEIAALPSKADLALRGREIVEKIGGVGATNVDLDGKRRELKEKLGAADGAMKTAKAALDVVKGQRGEVGSCPVCESRLTKVARGKLEVTLTNKWESAGRERQRINEVLSVTPEPISTATLQREADELSAKETRLVRLLDSEKALAARLLEETEQLDSVPSGTPGDPAAAQEAETLATRIAKGEEIRDALVAYAAARKSYEVTLDAKASGMKRHAALDQLVADLGPTGIRKGCGNAGMFAFHESLNALLKPRGFVVDLRPAMDAEGDPIVTVKGKSLPLAMLSGGERIAFGAAFACAVASVTGLGVVSIDDFERLDTPAHDAVMGILESSGHQAFVFSVEREDAEGMAAEVNAEGGALRMFLLRDGQLVAPGIGAEVAA